MESRHTSDASSCKDVQVRALTVEVILNFKLLIYRLISYHLSQNLDEKYLLQ